MGTKEKMKTGHYLFTSESVSKGHPDKVADQISDAMLDAYLAQEPDAHVACETMVTTDRVMLAGEISATCNLDYNSIVRNTIKEIGYTHKNLHFDYENCFINNNIHKQSPDIAQGVNREKEEDQGAGDQGMMFGYATNETPSYMPITWYLSHKIIEKLTECRENGTLTYLRPDAKSQVTVEYDENDIPIKVDTIVVSTQHEDWASEEKMHEVIEADIKNIVLNKVISELPNNIKQMFYEYKLYVNPTGKFVIGGPHGDAGLTGRKIIVDTYGGACPHGGGAFSGKDPSKVDRSGAYACRHIAKNIVAAGIADKVQVQVSYAIGVAEPVSFCVNTMGTSKVDMTDGELAQKISQVFDMRPAAIIKRFNLKSPIYKVTAEHGHFGINSYKDNGLTYYPWEKVDYLEVLRKLFFNK